MKANLVALTLHRLKTPAMAQEENPNGDRSVWVSLGGYLVCLTQRQIGILIIPQKEELHGEDSAGSQ